MQEKKSNQIKPLLDIERVKTAKLFGVLWSELPNFDLHASLHSGRLSSDNACN